MEVDVGANIKKARQQKHLSQTGLSRLSGISQSAISDIENPQGTKRPNTDTIKKIANALQCSVSELMGEKDIETDIQTKSPSSISENELDRELLILIHQLPQEKKKLLVEFLQQK